MHPDNQALLHRLNRLNGQIKAIKKPITNQETLDCTRVFRLLKAAQNALNKFGEAYVSKHLDACLTEGIGAQDLEAGLLEIIHSAFSSPPEAQTLTEPLLYLDSAQGEIAHMKTLLESEEVNCVKVLNDIKKAQSYLKQFAQLYARSHLKECIRKGTMEPKEMQSNLQELLSSAFNL